MKKRDYLTVSLLLALAWLIPLGVTIWFVSSAHAAQPEPVIFDASPVPVALWGPDRGGAAGPGARAVSEELRRYLGVKT